MCSGGERAIAAQGVGNIVASAIGGMPGTGAMGASLVNLSSGAKSRVYGVIEGILTVLLGAFVSGIPVVTLAGVLIVVGLRMIDTDPLRVLESRSSAVLVQYIEQVCAEFELTAETRMDRGFAVFENLKYRY